MCDGRYKNAFPTFLLSHAAFGGQREVIEWLSSNCYNTLGDAVVAEAIKGGHKEVI